MRVKNVLLILFLSGISVVLNGQYDEYMKKIGKSKNTSYVMYADPDGNLFYVDQSGQDPDLWKYDLEMDMSYVIKNDFVDNSEGYNSAFGSIAPTPDGDTVYCMTTAGHNHGVAKIFRLICSKDKLEYLTEMCGTNFWMIFNLTLSKDGKSLYYIGNNTGTGKALYKVDLGTLECSEILDLDPIIPHRDLCFGGINVWDDFNNFYLPVWSWDYDDGDLAVLQVNIDNDEYSARVIEFTDDGTPFGDRLLPGFRHHSCWSGIGASSNGNIYIGASNHFQTSTGTGTTGNVAMYKYDPVKDEMTLLNDLESVSKSVNNWMSDESQHKVHTFLIENADKKIYFATMDYAPSSVIRGSHIYTIDIETDEITDYSKTQTYLMNRDLNVIENGNIPTLQSGVFIEYYALKGIALHPNTPEVMYGMTYARSASGSGWDVETGNIIRYKLEGDFTSSKVISRTDQLEAKIYPNPFNDRITFHFSNLPAGSPAMLYIYDLYGRLILAETLNREGTFIWNGNDKNGKDIPYGLYIYKVDNGDTYSGKIMKIK